MMGIDLYRLWVLLCMQVSAGLPIDVVLVRLICQVVLSVLATCQPCQSVRRTAAYTYCWLNDDRSATMDRPPGMWRA